MPARSLVGCLVVLMTLVVVSACFPANSQAAGNGQPTDWNRYEISLRGTKLSVRLNSIPIQHIAGSKLP